MSLDGDTNSSQAITPRVRDGVLNAKRSLACEREKLREQHDSGSPGIQVCARLSDFFDTIILRFFEEALADFEEKHAGFVASNTALVPHGGYGRRDLAPFSDVDLMLLFDPVAEADVERIARRIVTDMSDLGVQLGFSVRTAKEACKMANRDPVIFTSQVESRFLAGSVQLFSKFMRRFRQQTKRRSTSIMQRVIQARQEEREKFDKTVFLLEPDVKKSVGALRDIHLLRWIGFARHGDSSPANLRLKGVLAKEDERALRRAYEFLLRLRNEMHFQAGRPTDVLRRQEQMRVAKFWNYDGDDALLPVERFMQEYFDHTCQIRDICEFFLANARRQSAVVEALGHLVSHQMDGLYRVGPIHIGANARGLAKLQGNLAEVLRLMELANQADKRITHDTWTAIREDMTKRDNIVVTVEAARRFMSLLNYNARLGQLLRRLHELRVLEKLIVGMDHARHLLQFNEYHKYTVDEHSIRAVERATDFFSDLGPLGRAYRKIRRRALFHLALLVHDVGKGFTEDHSIVGKRLAGKTAARLKLSRTETEILEFLVEYHLKMSHLAFRRDTSDEAIIIQFAQEVGSPEVLRMLFVLTAADLASVGPGVLNPWKIEVLWQLYQRAMVHLGGRTTSARSEEIAESQRQQLIEESPSDDDDGWYRNQITALPDTYVMDNSASAVLDDLQRMRDLKRGDTAAWGRYLNDREVCDYSVGSKSPIPAGAFHRITGAMSVGGLSILSGSLHTLSDGLVLFRFLVEDPDFDQRPPAARLEEVSQAIVQHLDSKEEVSPTFRRVWGANPQPDQLSVRPTRIVVDNSTLNDFTILDIFTHDRAGLIYQISKTLHELGLEVCFAKIGTYLDQVVDVFYVTDRNGGKIENDERIQTVRSTLLDAIENG